MKYVFSTNIPNPFLHCLNVEKNTYFLELKKSEKPGYFFLF